MITNYYQYLMTEVKMNEEKINFKNLIIDQIDSLKENRNSVLPDVLALELTALLYAAIYQNDCLLKIINTKMTSICPSLASEAFTVANEVAEKIKGARIEERNKDDITAVENTI